jgi:hypothetical protein
MGSGREATSSSSGGSEIAAGVASCSSSSLLASIFVMMDDAPCSPSSSSLASIFVKVKVDVDDDDGPESCWILFVLAFSFPVISSPSPNTVKLKKSRFELNVGSPRQFQFGSLGFHSANEFGNREDGESLEGFPNSSLLPLVMGGGAVAGSEAGRLVRCFIILEELGRETWTEVLGRRKVLPAVVMEFVETDSGCFPFDIDEIEVKVGDVGGGSFGYQANYISNRSKEGEGT